MTLCAKRVTRDLQLTLKNQPTGVIVETNPSNMFTWTVTMIGPESTPYAGGQFRFTIDFPPEYPFSIPILKFTHKIYHPNIRKDGTHICSDELQESNWKPAMTPLDLIHAVLNLLKTPNPSHAVEEDVAMEYSDKPALFAINARQWTANYAK